MKEKLEEIAASSGYIKSLADEVTKVTQVCVVEVCN